MNSHNVHQNLASSQKLNYEDDDVNKQLEVRDASDKNHVKRRHHVKLNKKVCI